MTRNYAKPHPNGHTSHQALLDRDAVTSGAATAGQPWQHYDLGHGYCSYTFFEQCPHRMACARCDFYIPKASSKGQLLEAKENLQRMLHRSAAYGEATARIGWCITEHRIGVITGEVGAGKTVAIRTALSTLDNSRNMIIYLPNPTIGVRGIHHQIVLALGGQPLVHHATLVPKPPQGGAVDIIVGRLTAALERETDPKK